MRKRYLSAVMALGLMGSGVLQANADILPDRFPQDLLFASAPLDVDPIDTSWQSVGELNRLSASAIVENSSYLGQDGERITVGRVASYLESKGSPLAPFASDFVEAGIANDVDPRAVIAIAGIESTLGKRQLGHNAWGWSGGPGGSLSRWSDWPTAIHAYTALLGEKYDTNTIDVAFAQRYCPPNWRHWLDVVSKVYAEI